MNLGTAIGILLARQGPTRRQRMPPKLAAVHAYLRSRPRQKVSAAEVARDTGQPQPHVCWRLKKLAEYGLATREGAHRSYLYTFRPRSALE